MAIVKYIRVSTEHQNTARQEQDESRYDKVYVDKCSGKDMRRPGLQAMLDWVRKGDTVVVESYSRLSRNTPDLFEIVQTLNDRGVTIISQKEPQIDTTTSQGKFALSIIAGLAQYERELTLERQAEGIAIAKAEGRMGRPRVTPSDEFKAIAQRWQRGEITAVEAARIAGVSNPTFYRYVKMLGISRQVSEQQADKKGGDTHEYT